MSRQSGIGVVDLGRIRLRKELGDKVMLLLEDPLRPGKIKYGSMRNYIEKLVAKDLSERGALAEDVLKCILESDDGY